MINKGTIYPKVYECSRGNALRSFWKFADIISVFNDKVGMIMDKKNTLMKWLVYPHFVKTTYILICKRQYLACFYKK